MEITINEMSFCIKIFGKDRRNMTDAWFFLTYFLVGEDTMYM